MTLTFVGDAPGEFVRQVVPTPEAITVRQHHSFIQLPDENYKPRASDPRTGEIIKGHVTLGSLRVRQDFLIAEGLLAPYEDGKPVSPKMQEMALARLRQLSAHEVGHTLGLLHNYLASTKDRASVMDYPHPLVKLKGEGAPDLSEAYATGIGAWDNVAIAYGYQDFPAGTDEKKNLNEILQAAIARGLIFISDQDARPSGGAHSQAHLWDNGANAIDELGLVMQVRARALNRFGEKNIRAGAPMATLEEALVPIYMYHRYQTEAVAKLVGGLNYTYAIRGDGQKAIEMIPAPEQRRALEALLQTLRPEALALPERALQNLPPRAYGYNRSRETFSTRTGLTFDPLAAAETAASVTVGLLLHPERAARLVDYHARNNNFPGLGEIVDKLINATWKSSSSAGYHAELQRVVDAVVLYHLMTLAANEEAATQVRAFAWQKLNDLKSWLEKQAKKANDESARAHYAFAAAHINQFQSHPKETRLTAPVEPPAGPPIGMDETEFCNFDYARK